MSRLTLSTTVAEARVPTLFGVQPSLARGEGRAAGGGDLFYYGSLKRRHISAALAGAAQLQTTVNSSSVFNTTREMACVY
jgi:hypothetical protein